MTISVQNIVETIKENFTSKAEVRDRTLRRSRELIAHCANTIRAVHRHEYKKAIELLKSADNIAMEMVTEAKTFIDVYYAGYTQDALKELSEAHITYALITEKPLPTPQDLAVENAAYINGLAESVGELRRYTLDSLRQGDIQTSQRALEQIDEIYTCLITVDFPSAITSNLRRKTDVARSILERTRGDVTTAVRQESMKKVIMAFEKRVEKLET